VAGATRAAGGLTRVPSLRLRPHGGQLHVPSLLAHLGPRGVPGMEEIAGTTYRRVLRLPGGNGVASLTVSAAGASGTLALEDPSDRAAARAALRALLALDADAGAADAVLARDRALAPLVAAAPGVRVPGAADGAELAIRTVIGQQISVAAARTQAAVLAAGLGRPLPQPEGTLAHAFPSPQAIADAPDALLRMPASRRRTIRILATALVAGDVDARRGADPAALRASLLELPGIGPWTAEYVAMRAAGDPDAFPASDLGLLRSAAALGLPSEPRALAAHAERWRPFRSFGAQRLWAQNSLYPGMHAHA
jgi:AraC family transcriptional regulator, regulatory protein of adaptative response / DNA-3-methyladenine glycosylase II